MPKRTAYVGHHRGRHRAEVHTSSRSVTLPGAAAAALTLTATGVAVVPGLAGSATASENKPTGPSPRTTSADPSLERQTIADARAQLARADLLERAREARAEAAARASRTKARKAIEDQRRAALAAAQRWVMPVEGYRFSSAFGTRWGRLHAGDDFAATTGTRIGALSSGTVVFAGQQSGYGNKVEIRHWDGTVSVYAHMNSIAVRVGQTVAPGAKVGEVGNTGRSTGPHLHLEIRPGGGGPTDPEAWLGERGLAV